jgi:dTDP-glucose pyrophosphorylase
MWEETLLSINATLEDAIRVLNQSSLRIVLIVNSEKLLLGTLSDGDIRRALLNGLQLKSSISEVVNTNPVFVFDGVKRAEVLRIMAMKKVFQVPVVNQHKRVVGLHLWDELLSPPIRTNPFVIMAGGKGTRLLPRTTQTPKPMLKIAGKPILEHIISRARKEGFENFYLAVHHLSEVIEEYFGSGSQFNVNIQYLREDSPLGTAGALSLFSQNPGESTVVTNGDVLTDVSFGNILDFHNQNESSATMAVQIYESQNPFGVVKTRGLEIVEYQEKPISRSLVNAGVYVLGTDIFEFVEKQKYLDMPDLFETAIRNGLKTSAFLIHENWMDLGSHEDFELAEKSLSDGIR